MEGTGGADPMLRRIPYITLWSRRFQESVTFYRDTRGLPVEHLDDGFAQFATEGTKLYVHAMREAPSLSRPTYPVELVGPPKPGEPVAPEE